jgi:hypothetical protein
MARSARGSRGQAQIARLLVTALLGAVGAYACANVANPPGGPPDVAPPRLVSVRPDSGAVVPAWRDEVELQFDEVIDEMPSLAGGTGGLSTLVLLSPVAGGIRVEWHRNRITVEPKEGWKPNRVYRLEVLPGLMDLRRNKLDTGRVVLFSTGPTIGSARLSGLALSWVEQRVLPRAIIEAVPLPDTIGYVTASDSTGRFKIEGLTPGRYLVYATADQNTNRRRDLRESYDSALVQIDSIASVVLFAFPHDTVGPRLRAATYLDSLHARLEFSQPLAGAPRLDTATVRANELPDSARVGIAAVITVAEFDSLARQRRITADTGAVDSVQVKAPADTAQRRDTSEVKRLLAQRPVPSDKVVLRFAAPLKPETRYLITVTGATNLSGAKADGQAVVAVPKPQPADTSRRAAPARNP